MIYGFEGDDFIHGGDGIDKLFGEGGDDTIRTGENGVLGDGDFASGGTGNDKMYGDNM